jgi:transcription elongation factor Elf1
MATCPKCKEQRGCSCNFKIVAGYPTPVCSVCEYRIKQEARALALEAKEKAKNKEN